MFPDMFLWDKRERWHGGGQGAAGRGDTSQGLCCARTPPRYQETGLARMSPGSYLQSEEVGEPLEDAGTQAADAVVGEVPAR